MNGIWLFLLIAAVLVFFGRRSGQTYPQGSMVKERLIQVKEKKVSKSLYKSMFYKHALECYPDQVECYPDGQWHLSTDN
jgi:hypothetical protein